MRGERGQFLRWCLGCHLSGCDVLALDLSPEDDAEAPEGWHRKPEKGQGYDLVILGRESNAAELARLVRRLKKGGDSHIRVNGSISMPPAVCGLHSTPTPWGVFSIVRRLRV